MARSWLRRLFRRADPPAPPPPSVPRAEFDALADRFRDLRARYDLVRTDDDNRRHWSNADGLSAAAANAAGVRFLARNRSRYEYDNGAYVNGIVRTRADDLVGPTGPRLQMAGPDDGLNAAIELVVSTWAARSYFAEKLHTLDQTRCRDGEAFALYVTNPRIDFAVQFDILPIEADRIADPQAFGLMTPNRFDGVEYDNLGQAVAYWVLDTHPGDQLAGAPLTATRVDARFMLHWFRVDRPGQVRGMPELAASLPLSPYQRRWTLATLAAAEYAASQSGVLETDGPLDPDTTTLSPFQPVEFDRNTFVELPAGVKLNQLKAEHPNQLYAPVHRQISKEIARPVRMPGNVATADSSDSNFSSAKLDHMGYRAAIKVDRSFAALRHLDRIAAEVCREAIAAGLLPKGVDVLAIPHAWTWAGWASMDKDQAEQDASRLINGTLTYPDYCADNGQDWRVQLKKKADSEKYAADLGTSIAPEKPKVPPESPVPEEGAPNVKPQAPPPARAAGDRFRLNGSSGGRA